MKIKPCSGFTAAGVASGLKKNGGKDLGLIVSSVPANAAAVFTRNKVQAAPVMLDKIRIQSGRCQAIIVNSGNANCCTGEQGMRDARSMSAAIAVELGIAEDLVQVASTGVIGEMLPVEKIQQAAPALARKLAPEGFSDLAEAIMTTDTVPKLISVSGDIDGKSFTLTAVAKGAGMIRPDMATMLCFVCTDAEISPVRLNPMLKASVDRSFNRITIDGDTSTNDTVLFLANGQSGAVVDTDARQAAFQEILDSVLIDLAKAIVIDGEGATKLVEVRVTGAVSDEEARRVADTVAHSNLFKTALFGEDANWGRIIAAVGRSGAAIDPNAIDICFDEVMMVKDGLGQGKNVEALATEVLKRTEFPVTIDLKSGTGRASVFTCDFSVEYVRINADYRS